jgi:Lrp/AsnC family transcriptional regulator, leucine-responsive regulatory protein
MNQKSKLDAKDIKILTELDKNARQSSIQIGKKVKLSKDVVKYRIDKMVKQGSIIRFHTVINYFKLGLTKFKLYLRLTNADDKKLKEIAEYFQKHKKTEWVVLSTGKWDLISGFIVENVNEFDDEVQNVLNKFSKYIQEKAVTTTLYLAHQTREFLKENSKKETSKIVYHTTKDKQEKIDQTDTEIIKIITNNSRMSVVEIAKKLKSTPRVIQYRMKDLEKKNIILAYKAHIEPKSLGRIFCKAIIYLTNTTKEKLEEFINYTSSLSGAIWPQRVLGNWDFELDFELENYDTFQKTILNLKKIFPDIIKNHEFCIVSKEFKLDLFPETYSAQ